MPLRGRPGRRALLAHGQDLSAQRRVCQLLARAAAHRLAHKCCLGALQGFGRFPQVMREHVFHRHGDMRCTGGAGRDAGAAACVR